MNENELEGILEGLLFMSGEPVTFDRLAEIVGIGGKVLSAALDKLMDAGEEPSRGIIVRRIENKYQMCTKPQHHTYLSRLAEPRLKPDLSQAAYETLAVIAYNGPVTKSRIEQIRGVNSDSCIERLIDRNLIKEAGRLDLPGRPMLFEITEEFLRSFGLRSHSDLPPIVTDPDDIGASGVDQATHE